MAEEWTSVRLRKTTHSKLAGVFARLEKARQLHHWRPGYGEGIASLDDLVLHLVEQWEARLRRAAASKARKRAARRKARLVAAEGQA